MDPNYHMYVKVSVSVMHDGKYYLIYIGRNGHADNSAHDANKWLSDVDQYIRKQSAVTLGELTYNLSCKFGQCREHYGPFIEERHYIISCTGSVDNNFVLFTSCLRDGILTYSRSLLPLAVTSVMETKMTPHIGIFPGRDIIAKHGHMIT